MLRPRGRPRAWLALLAPVTATTVVALLPVLRTGGFAIGNDTYTYCAFSEWLQRHGFSEPCRLDPFSPVTGVPWLWQRLHYDLGIAHLLALVQAGRGGAGLAASSTRPPRPSGWSRSPPPSFSPAARSCVSAPPGRAGRRSSSRSCPTPSTGGTTTASCSRRTRSPRCCSASCYSPAPPGRGACSPATPFWPPSPSCSCWPCTCRFFPRSVVVGAIALAQGFRRSVDRAPRAASPRGRPAQPCSSSSSACATSSGWSFGCVGS